MIYDESPWEWMTRAACRGEFSTMMPRGRPGGGTTSETLRDVARAREICRACSEREPCLEYALTCGPGGGPAKDGIWADCSPDELRAIARSRRMARAS